MRMLTFANCLQNGKSDRIKEFSSSINLGATFIELSYRKLPLPPSNWTVVGPRANTAPGLFQFTSQPTRNDPKRFRRARSPWCLEMYAPLNLTS